MQRTLEYSLGTHEDDIQRCLWCTCKNQHQCECHPGMFVFQPSQHLGDMTSVGAYSNCSGEFSAKSSEFRDEGLNIFS